MGHLDNSKMSKRKVLINDNGLLLTCKTVARCTAYALLPTLNKYKLQTFWMSTNAVYKWNPSPNGHCIAWACMLDVAYLIPEYNRLRDTLLWMQWRV